jgi:nucleotide-binding universal stress UspA family protein
MTDISAAQTARIGVDDPRPVVAGVDGSPSSVAAAEYAAALAERRGVPLRLLHGNGQWIRYHFVTGVPIAERPAGEQFRALVEQDMRRLVEKLRRGHPSLVTIEAQLVPGGAASVLIEESTHAQATVVGSRGAGGFAGLLLGSVSWHVVSHGHGPIIVVRPPIADDGTYPGPRASALRPKPLGPVLVAYDGSAPADAALDFAVTEALQRKVRLLVTNVYASHQELAQQMLASAMKPYATAHLDLDAQLLTIESDHVDFALVEASRGAALTVVGSRGHGGFPGLRLGSISRTLAHHSYGPVAVVHPH